MLDCKEQKAKGEADDHRMREADRATLRSVIRKLEAKRDGSGDER